jgi:hypothetical protein
MKTASIPEGLVSQGRGKCVPILHWLGGIAAILSSSVARAQPNFTAPIPEADGSIQVPSFKLPFSDYVSPEARALFTSRQRSVPTYGMKNPTIAELCSAMAKYSAIPNINRANQRDNVAVTQQTIGGVSTEVFTPKEGISPKNRNRVLAPDPDHDRISGARRESKRATRPKTEKTYENRHRS